MPPAEAPQQSVTSLEDHLSRLVAFESTTLPVISLYLNTQPDNHGRDHFEQFIRKEFASRAGTFPAGSVERESFDRDTARVKAYLETELQPSAEEKVEAVPAPEIPDSRGGTASDEPRVVLLPDLLITKARQTGSTVTFIEDAALLAPVGGVGAMLRWR
jgi:hypothetical protein